MPAPLNYLWDAGQSVYVITDCTDPNNTRLKVEAVRPGKVIRVRFEVLVTSTTPLPLYDVQVDGQSGTTELVEDDVFGGATALADAVAEYQTRIV